jgi:hypothetical protein
MKPKISPLFLDTRVLSRGLWPLLFMVSVLVLLPCGCGKNTSAVKSPDHTGTYTLDTVNGRKLPFNPLPRLTTSEFSSGAITLQADGGFLATVSQRMSDGKVTKRDSSGSYTKAGSSFMLQYKGAGTATATLEGDTFTVNDGDMKLVYRK